MTLSIASIGLVLLQWSGLGAPAAHPAPPVNRNHAVCSAPASGQIACLAKVYARADGSVKPAAAPRGLPSGYSPAQLRSAYGAPATGTGRIAVVTAYDNPYIAIDLNTYSRTFGLPQLPTCTSATQTSCFEKLDQNGGQFYPFANRGWAFETNLDVEVAHAICPGCRLTLVEANSASIASLTTAVDTAVASGAKVVSMSWGGSEWSGQTQFDQHFAAPGVVFTAASGDNGFSPSWPAASSHVLAIGGTTLKLTPTGQRATETTWAGTGSGCSVFEPKPTWQQDTGCSRRILNDLAAVANPATGAAIYTSYSPYGRGWFTVGGTSLATPLIGALVAQSATVGQAATAASLYGALGNPSKLFDVTVGTNGTCSPGYLCTAGAKYDGPTGVGAPVGLGAL